MEPQIEVTFEIDVNGILQVTALDQATGRQRNITVRASSGLIPSEVQSARTRLEAQFGRVTELETGERLRARLLGLLQSTRKTFDLLRRKLTEEERILAERTIGMAGAATEGSLEDMRAAFSDLEAVSEMLRQAMTKR